MGLFFTFLLLLTSPAWSLDTGTGADGACTSASLSAGVRAYNCTSLTIDANFSGWSAAGGTAVVIKVIGDVVVNNGVTLSLDGGNGTQGAASGNTTASIAGPNGGAGGGAGGNTVDTNSSNGFTGGGVGAGGGGVFVAGASAPANGGGGGGASYGVLGTIGNNGNTSAATVPSTGGSLGATYGAELIFESSFSGGSGGGGGGASDDDGAGLNPQIGGTGGAGGGALHIIVGGNITVNGTIRANGGNGGGSGDFGNPNAGGGGGSGGALWLQAVGDISVGAGGSLLATGGTGGLCFSNAGSDGDGGNGGNGRIRLDDSDGAIVNNGTITPAAVVSSTSTTSRKSYTSDIACGTVDLGGDDKSGPGGMMIGFLLAFVFLIGLKKPGHFTPYFNFTYGKKS